MLECGPLLLDKIDSLVFDENMYAAKLGKKHKMPLQRPNGEAYPVWLALDHIVDPQVGII